MSRNAPVLLYVMGGALQGGAISAEDGVGLKISSSTFEQNQAGYVSAIFEAV